VSLWSEFLNNQQRTIHKWKHYFPAYEAHFARYVNRPMLFLEIGCGRGGSAQMWKRYLGPHAQIVGIDINP
jgi:ubiquinone/menaquinone biosynthesis C-methylase UbiE